MGPPVLPAGFSKLQPPNAGVVDNRDGGTRPVGSLRSALSGFESLGLDLTYWTDVDLHANPQLLAHDTVSVLSAKYSRTPAQILFRYLTQSDIVPLTGTTSATHMREDLEIFDFRLAADELAAVSELIRS